MFHLGKQKYAVTLIPAIFLCIAKMHSEDTEYGIQSVKRAFDIIEIIGEQGEVGFSDLDEASDISRSTIHHYLKTLVQLGYVNNDGGNYSLSLKLFTRGQEAVAQHKLYRLRRNELDQVVSELNHEVQATIMVVENGMGTHIMTRKGNKAISTDYTVGSRVYLHATAAGKAYLSCLPDEEIKEILDMRGLPQLTKRTIVDRSEFLEEVEKVRSQGYATNDEETRRGMRAVAAPIIDDRSQTPAGALTVGGSVSGFTGELFQEKAPKHVMEKARVIGIWAAYN